MYCLNSKSFNNGIILDLIKVLIYHQYVQATYKCLYHICLCVLLGPSLVCPAKSPNRYALLGPWFICPSGRLVHKYMPLCSLDLYALILLILYSPRAMICMPTLKPDYVNKNLMQQFSQPGFLQ